MSLQGSLETFALPDVLVLLASTKKDGELRVVGGKVDGRIWVEKGQVVHSDVNGKEIASVDAVFELLRLESGTFSFNADTPAPSRHDPDTVDLVLADAQVRLGEWQEIARIVPHLDVVVDMAAEAPGGQVTISAADWRLLRTVAGGCTVHDLMRKLDESEFDTCKTVKDLVDQGLISVDLTAQPRRAADAPGTETRAATQARPASAETAERQGERRAGASDRRDEETDDELERFVEAAARPRRVRATTSAPGGPEAPESARGEQAGDKQAGAPQADEAKALVAQLAALGGENEEKIAKKVEEHLARGGELPEVPEGDEPINRGLLLKFLSSVRN